VKISLFTSGYMRYPLKVAFNDAKRFGYDGIEIWGGRPHAYPFDLKAGDIEELKQLSADYRVPIVAFTPETNAYPFNMMIGSERMRRESLDYIKLSMDMACEMGAPFTIISAAHAGYDCSHDEYWSRLVRNLQELVQYAETIDHTLLLEPLTPYESNVVTTADDLKKILEEVPSNHLAGMCDICAPFVQHEPIMSYFEKLGSKVLHVHFIDSDGSSETHYVPGDGQIPLKQLAYEIENEGYQGYCTIELVTSYINEPSLYSALAIERVKEFFN